ncbi:hypothetical protein E2C01_035961 [Portunus trituberculatus]|uniref:Uncharacterized protein n=1 Tax=Portunus trituberculatus TaxID=210409 RepID=A0A5B7F5P7_PORTR|nr:hypothetical protein [Portunus trituberculatus]
MFARIIYIDDILIECWRGFSEDAESPISFSLVASEMVERKPSQMLKGALRHAFRITRAQEAVRA